MNNGKKIIVPGNGNMQQSGLHPLVVINKKLIRELDDRDDVIRRQAANITAMNKVFTEIAEALGTPIPETPQDGITALAKMRERIADLVEKEKAQVCQPELLKAEEDDTRFCAVYPSTMYPSLP